MTTFPSCICRSWHGPTALFHVHNAFFRHTNQGLTCSSPHRSPEAVPRSKSPSSPFAATGSPNSRQRHGLSITLFFSLPENQDQAARSAGQHGRTRTISKSSLTASSPSSCTRAPTEGLSLSFSLKYCNGLFGHPPSFLVKSVTRPPGGRRRFPP
ncbi:hypothetical protein AXF42_Ash011556 [Apostasia shenzhenica]|uniref:Uncharacterized protein n=1 Tax=Apostasia shenzhenica TaxID=1088818 RepID=A0A2I0BAX1_9ASPA|nr:hypothetical protein AXF42_Ash011556 [Apostasia shenzhenica]